ncbi:hypothetical protein ACROYT_G034751 [Oculina patagonica]
MAACVLDGDKLCEVAGNVKWSSVDRCMMDYHHGSLALYKLSSSYYIHAITAIKRAKFPLKPDKFNLLSRESRLTLSLSADANKAAVSIHLRDATPNQLGVFLDSLNTVKTYFASFKGKLSSSSSREDNIQNIENQPCNNNNFSITSPRVTKYESPLRSNLTTFSPSRSTQKATPSNFYAKQMNLPSSYSSQNKKTPLVDRTFARDNLSNTSSGNKSASSFYGSRNSAWSPSDRKSTRGPGLMPPPRPGTYTSRLASQISFRSREKLSLEKEVALTGFSNLGNTCYMNAILQSLFGVPPFVQDLSNKALLEKVHPQCLYRCLYSVLLCKKRCENPEVLKNCLRKLKRTISEAATRFSGYHQHDAHEFLCQVFDQLKDDVSTCSSPPKDTPKESNTLSTDSKCPVTRSFESGVVHTVSCKQCGESTPKEEIYHAFSLVCDSSDMSSFGAINMQTLIEKHFEDEELEYSCSKCESKEAVLSHSFSRLPRVLILHLKRYGYDNLTEEQAKKQDKVKIERFIDLRMLCSSNTKAPLAFQPKSPLKMSPTKSSRKPQKRHFICEDDDDDSSDFQPSPSVRRKLAHSFSDVKATSTAKVSPQNKEANSEDEVEVIGISKLNKTVEYSKLGKTEQPSSTTDKTSDKNCTQFDIDQSVNLENTTGRSSLGLDKPVWEGTEEEQMAWAMAESAKSAEKESREKLNEQESTKIDTECLGKSPAATEDTTSNFEDEDFNLISDVSDEDLMSAAQESGPEETCGLKGGAPITLTTQNCSDNLDISDVHDAGTNKNCNADSGLEKNLCKETLLKNSPIMCVKRRNGHLMRKRKTANNVSMTKTPMLGKFDGDLFEDSVKENKDSANVAKANDRPKSSWFDGDVFEDSVKENKVSTSGAKPSDSPKTSWYSGSFGDDDMAKAINMSLQEQKMMTDEDEELKKALQISLQEFEDNGAATDQPDLPASVDTENLTDPAFQDEDGEPSTHSYRLISIVSHLGTSSTSGHYISDVYDCKTKQWTSYDDSTATKLTEHGVRYKRQHSGYIFFYLYKQCVDAIENASPCKENTQR